MGSPYHARLSSEGRLNQCAQSIPVSARSLRENHTHVIR
jgi:hypothetical protein